MLVETPAAAYIKDYDAIPGEGPDTWMSRWDLSHWGVLAAFEDGVRVGGAAIAWRTPEVTDLGAGGDETAVLWDLRVHPAHRSRGVGRRLVGEAFAWARARGCSKMEVETQHINVSACRLYERMGFELTGIDKDGYGDGLDEARLIWVKEL